MEQSDLIDKIGDLPTLPIVATRINHEIENTSLTAHGLGEIITGDSALTAKILRLANSAFYGMPKQIASIDKAVTILGFNTVKNLALSLSVFSLFKENKKSEIDLAGFWNHSLACAVCARMLIAGKNRQLAEEAFLFGILHDIGKIVFIQNDLVNMEKVIMLSRDEGISQNEAETRIFGFNHQQIGARLAKKWEFPDCLVKGIRLHHDLPPNTKKLEPDIIPLIQALCIANQMAKALHLGQSTNPERTAIPKIMWKFLEINRAELPDLSIKIKENYNMILRDWGNN